MAKEKVDLLIKNANELVTPRSVSKQYGPRDLTVLSNGAVSVDEGRIIAVDKTSTIEQHFKSETVIDASRKLVTPGFVDAHTHVVFAGTREEEFKSRLQGLGYMEILAKGGGILKTVRETRKASKRQLIETARKTLDLMLKHGTTTVEIKSGYGLTTEDEIKCLEAAQELDREHSIDVVTTFLGAHAVPPEYKNETNGYVSLITEEMIPKIAEERLAEFCDVFCENGAFNIEQSRRILKTGKEFGLRPKIHADELSSLGGAELAASVKATSADHLLFASNKGLKAMIKEGVIPVLLPLASFSLMTGKYADAREIIRMGGITALGTDFNPSCWSESMQIAIAFACRELRLTQTEAIAAATIGAARAIGRSRDVGSLEKGKRADIVIFNIPNHKFLGYKFGVNLVHKVLKNGKVVIDSQKE